MAPSPITAITWSDLFDNLFAVAIPSPAEIEVELWAAPKGSNSLSDRFVKPDNPLPCRKVRILSFLPVKILWGYDWWPTSHINLSFGVSKTWWSATVNSTTPKPAPRWPPVFETASIISLLTSSDRTFNSSLLSFFISEGKLILFKYL